jgi:hypothetical protein
LYAQESDRPASFLVKLRTPVGPKISHAGDPVSASVISPESYLGGKLEGTVVEASAGPPAKLRFVFRTLEFKGKRQSIASQTVEFVNSKGHPGADEQERPVKVDGGTLVATAGDFVLDEGAEVKLQVSRAR